MSGFKDLGLSYEAALHGMQTGVKFEIENRQFEVEGQRDPNRAEKHLRVGINSAHSSHAALAELLMEKGLFTRAEYEEKIRLLANNELWLYESRHPGYTFR